MDIIFGVFTFFFGTIIGSFLNVVVYRYNTGRSVNGRSMCMTCSRGLRWFELAPIASYIVQSGRCTKCRSKISPQYPLVEFATGLVFLAIGYKYAWLAVGAPQLFSVLFTYAGFLLSLLIVISVYDFRHKIIPDELVWGFNIVAFIGIFMLSGNAVIIHMPTIMAVLAGPLIALPFFAIWLLSKGKMMGLGDVKLMLGIGWLLGLSGGILAVMLAFWTGAIIGIFLLAIRGRQFTLKSAIPFGPFLALAAAAVFLCNIDLYGFLSLLSSSL